MNEQEIKFKHKTGIQIRFKDVDSMGHVNNANHFTYFELARVNYFRDVVGEQIDWSKEGIILAHMEIDYKTPILLEDTILVYSCVSKFGSKSFEVAYKIVKVINGNEIICATGKSVQVCFNYETNQTIPVPESWKQKVELYEKSIS